MKRVCEALGSYHDLVDVERRFVSIVDDDIFPQQRVSLSRPSLAVAKLEHNCRGIDWTPGGGG